MAKRIRYCVFCGTQAGRHPIYVEQARRLGQFKTIIPATSSAS